MAAVSVVGGAAVALALPVGASPARLNLAQPAVSAGAERADGLTASRSSARRVVTSDPAVSAPTDASPLAPEQVGVFGVRAVPKPKPKPTPSPAAEAGSAEGTGPVSSSSSRTYSTSISGQCANIGLITKAARLCSAVDSVFDLGSIGGYRPSAGEHSTGQAIDFMISSRSQGDAIAAWVQSHAGEFDVQYVIWRQRYWAPGGSWELMEDRGSPTANHMDHVHVTVNY